MRRLKSFIEIGDYQFDFVTSVEITSGWDVFTDTAKITIPKRLRYRKGTDATKNIVSGETPIFKRGDPVKISLGYWPNPALDAYPDPPFYTAFEGWVTEVSPKRPIVILCEDNMYLLKKIKIDKYESNGPKNLRDLLPELRAYVSNFPGEYIKNIKTVDMNVGEVIITKLSYAKFLDYLKRTYGLLSYMRGDTLYCGFANITQSPEDAEVLPDKTIKLIWDRDLISTSSLNYKVKDDILIALTAYSILEDNSRLESKKGDDDGDTRNLYFYNVDQAALDKLAEESVDKFKYTGYRGSFTIFGVPQVRHGDAVLISNDDIPDQAGKYLVKQVRTTHGTSGSRQEIHLDKLISQ